MSRGLLVTKPRQPLARGVSAGAMVVLASLWLLAGCETLDSRLARNQGILRELPAQHQELIRQGLIEVGFSPTEVYLAWGAPSRKAITENAQGTVETWYYTTTLTETDYREERYFDREFNTWRFVSRPHHRYLETLSHEAVFANGALSSFTLYPAASPFRNGPPP